MRRLIQTILLLQVANGWTLLSSNRVVNKATTVSLTSSRPMAMQEVDGLHTRQAMVGVMAQGVTARGGMAKEPQAMLTATISSHPQWDINLTTR